MAALRGEHADGDGVIEPERVADRDRPLADLELVRVAEARRLYGMPLDLHDREVGLRVGADELGGDGLAVGERDLELIRVVDDVVVGEDVALAVEHHARAHAALLHARPAVVVIGFMLLSSTVKIVQEYERGVIFRLGRLVGARGPGLFFLIPGAERMR